MSNQSGSVKVLQVASVDITVEKLLLPLIDELIANGFAVDIACADSGYSEGLRRKGYNVHDIHFTRSALSLSHCRALLDLYSLIRQGHYDIVHVHTPIAAVIGRLAAKIARVPTVIYTAHGFYFHENMTPWLRHSLVFVEKFMCRFTTDWLFTQSEEDAKFALKKNFSPDDRILWIANGANLDRFSGNHRADYLRSSWNIDKEDKVIGFIGRIVREKGIIDLIEALTVIISDIPKAKSLVVGDTLDSDRDYQAVNKVKEVIQSHGLQDSVIFIGFRDDIPELLSVMDVLVLPSYREGMPMTIIEAMASEKPVVATNIRGCREEVVHGETGFLVPVNDSVSLAKAITQILADEELAKRMGKAGRKRALEYYDEKKTIEKQLNIYNNI